MTARSHTRSRRAAARRQRMKRRAAPESNQTGPAYGRDPQPQRPPSRSDRAARRRKQKEK